MQNDVDDKNIQKDENSNLYPLGLFILWGLLNFQLGWVVESLLGERRELEAKCYLHARDMIVI